MRTLQAKSKAAGTSSSELLVDVGRGINRVRAVECISCLITSMRIFHFGLGRLLTGPELLAIQGFDPSHLSFRVPGLTYTLLNRLAGQPRQLSSMLAKLQQDRHRQGGVQCREKDATKYDTCKDTQKEPHECYRVTDTDREECSSVERKMLQSMRHGKTRRKSHTSVTELRKRKKMHPKP